MRHFLAFVMVFFAFHFVSSASGLLDGFHLAIFDRAGFASMADGHKIDGSFQDNFSNSAGLSFFIEAEGYDENFIRGLCLFSFFCLHDYIRLNGTAHNRLRYGLETSFFFLNTSFSESYDFNTNKIDLIGSLGFKIGYRFNRFVGLEINSGIERGFISKDNFVRLNAGILIVPTGFISRKGKARLEREENYENNKMLLEEALKADGTAELEKFCDRQVTAPEFHDVELLHDAVAEIALRKLKVAKEDIVFASPHEIENPYTIDREKIFYLRAFSTVAFLEDGIMYTALRNSDFSILFFVRYNEEIKNAQSIRHAFFRSAGTKTVTFGGLTRVIPAFDCEYFF